MRENNERKVDEAREGWGTVVVDVVCFVLLVVLLRFLFVLYVILLAEEEIYEKIARWVRDK